MRRHRWTIALRLALPLLFAGPLAGRGADVPGLYEGKTIVTGQGDENRATGVEACFSDVLAKVSGDFRMLARTAPAGDAAGAVTGFSYHDRMAGLPLHDEEGTRRRPYDLSVDFDPARVAAALTAMGVTPWAGPRPSIVPFVIVSRDGGSFLLASDGEASYGQRDALREAAWQAGLPLRLPDTVAFERDSLSGPGVVGVDLSRLDALAKRDGGDVALAGSLSWSDEAIRWTGHWSLTSGGHAYAWDGSSESFDAAYRGAMRGAALVLSGHAPGDHFTVP